MQGRHGKLRGGELCIVLAVGCHGVVSAQPLPPFYHTEGATERSYLDFAGTSEPWIFRGVDPARTGTEPSLTLVDGELACALALLCPAVPTSGQQCPAVASSGQQCPAHSTICWKTQESSFCFPQDNPAWPQGVWPEEKSSLPMSMWKIVSRRDRSTKEQGVNKRQRPAFDKPLNQLSGPPRFSDHFSASSD